MDEWLFNKDNTFVCFSNNGQHSLISPLIRTRSS